MSLYWKTSLAIEGRQASVRTVCRDSIVNISLARRQVKLNTQGTKQIPYNLKRKESLTFLVSIINRIEIYIYGSLKQ